MSETQPTARRRRVSMVVLTALLLVLGAVLFREAWDYHEARRLEAIVAGIRVKGEPVTSFDIARTQAGSGEVWREEGNEAARYYAAAAALVRSPTPANGGYRTFDVCRPDRVDKDSRPLDEQVAALRRYVATHSDAIGLLHVATALPFRHFSPGTEYSYRTAQMMSLGRLSSARTCAHIADGDSVGAADAAIATVRLLREPNSARWQRDRIVADVVAVLERSRPTEAALGRLQDALREATVDDDVERGLLRDRVDLLATIDRHFGGARWSAPRGAGPFQSAFNDYAFRPWNRRGMIGLLRTLNAMIDAGRQPWPAKLAAIEAVGEEELLPGWATSERIGAGVMLSEYRSRARGEARWRVTTDAAMLAVALVRYRAARGTLPATLADLTPTYLKEKPLDLLTGQDMRYVRQPDGFVVYSVGPDGKDDGGQVRGERSSNPRDRRPEDPKDWGVRVRLDVPPL